LYVREDGREFLIFGFEKRDEEFIYVVVWFCDWFFERLWVLFKYEN
jgi:hypothetical protein